MSELGIDLIKIIIYIAIFLLLYFFTKKFTDKVLLTLEERKKVIEEGIRNAKEAENLKAEKQSEAEEEKKAILAGAYEDAKVVVENAKKKESVILMNSEVKANEAIKAIAKESEELKEKAKQDALLEARDLIAASVKKVLEGIELDKNQEEDLIKKSLDSLK